MNDDRKSRTKLKNEVKALQDLGEQLVELSTDQLKTIQLPEELLSAVKEARQISQHIARRRQMQYIGKLMREIDPEPVQNFLENIRQGNYQSTMAFRKIEKWRDELKEGNLEIIEEIIASCPNAQRQRLNQLIRNARNSRTPGQVSKASKALFRYLKEIDSSP